jgi:hypothetical protein
VIVKKPGNQLFQPELTGWIAHRSGVLKKAPLDLGWKIVPLHHHCGSEASQDALFMFAK